MPTAAAQAGLTAYISYGVTVSGSTTYTQINLASEIDGPEPEGNAIEFKQLGQAFTTKIPGQWDPGQITFTVAYNGQDTTHQFLTALIGTRTIVQWKIDYPDGSSCAVPGWLSGFPISGMTPDSPVTGSGTVTLTGAPVWSTSP